MAGAGIDEVMQVLLTAVKFLSIPPIITRWLKRRYSLPWRLLTSKINWKVQKGTLRLRCEGGKLMCGDSQRGSCICVNVCCREYGWSSEIWRFWTAGHHCGQHGFELNPIDISCNFFRLLVGLFACSWCFICVGRLQEVQGKLEFFFGSDRFELIAFMLGKEWHGPNPLNSKMWDFLYPIPRWWSPKCLTYDGCFFWNVEKGRSHLFSDPAK